MPTIIDLSLLAPTQGFLIEGAVQGDQAGRSVSNAGDINGDGIDDFLIGAPLFDRPFPNPQPGSQPRGVEAGIAYVIYGRAGGTRSNLDLDNLSPSDGFAVVGADSNEYAGTSVSAAGDVNGDGLDDFIVGARYGSDSLSFEGKAYIIFGKVGVMREDILLDSLAPTDGFSVLGDNTFDYIGTAVSAAGDINGDGFDDIILGAPNGDNLANGGYNAGEAYIIFGRAGATRANIDLSSFAPNDGFILNGNAMLQSLGVSVSNAGDVNGDGIDDVIVGARLGGYSIFNGYNGSSGQSFVVYGKLGATRGDIDLRQITASDGFRIIGVNDGDQAGYSVSAAGDINGDGIDDVIIGANRGGDGGEAYIVYGVAGTRGVVKLGTLTASQGFVIAGDAASDAAGFSVSAVGDVNGDGIDDVIVGAPQNDLGGAQAGAAYLIFGKAGALRGRIDLSNLSAADGLIIQGDLAGDNTGASVSGAGDINGDGFADIIVSAPFSANGTALTGDTWIIYGSANLSPPTPVSGTIGDDILTNPIGNNIIDGLGGFDTLDMSAFTSTITLNTIAGTIVSSQGGSDSAVNVESFLLGSGNDVVLLGNNGFTVRAGAGSDQVTGGSGADTIEGGAGDDVLNGGDGIDTVSYASSAFGVTVHLDNPSAQNTVQQGIDTLTGFENIMGSARADTLFGDAGNNVITGGAGFDTIVSGGGTNTLIGGADGDTYFVQGVNDIVTEAVGGGFDIVLSQVNFTLSAGSEVEALAVNTSVGISLTGNELQQTLTGNVGSDTLSGGGGNDLIISGGGTNILIGGTGADIYFAQGTNDIVTELAGGGFDVLLAGGNLTLAAGSEVEVIAVNTTSGVTITGSDTNQTIQGAGGNDRFIGGLGNDTLTGSGGADTFVLRNSFADRDFITDFASGSDKLEISAALFGGGLAVGILSGAQFLSGAGAVSATTAAQRFIYNSSTGNLLFDADGNGAGSAVLFANLSSTPTLTAADFLIAV